MIETNNHIFFWYILGLMTQKYAVFILLLALMPLAQCQQSQHDMPIQAYDEETLQALDKAIQSNPRNPPAWLFARYFPDDYTEVRIYAPASEWKDSEFKNAMISLKVTSPAGYY